MNRFYPARGARTCKKPRNNNKITGNQGTKTINKTSTTLIFGFDSLQYAYGDEQKHFVD